MNSEKEIGLAVVFGVMCLVRGTTASASCAPGMATVQERLASHDAVFVGRVSAIRQIAIPPESEPTTQTRVYPNEVTFEVVQAWKGIHEPRVVAIDHVVFESHVAIGHDFLVFASHIASDARLVIMGCGETVLAAKASEDIQALGKPEFVPPAVPANSAISPSHSGVTARANSGTRCAAGRAGYRGRWADRIRPSSKGQW